MGTKWSEVDISLNHEILASFSLHMWPWLPKSWANLAGVTVWRVQPYGLETEHQWLNHFVYVQYGFSRWSEVDISLNHVVMASFSTYKWPHLSRSGANLAGVTVLVWNPMPMRQHNNGPNTLYISHMDVWSGLRWGLASIQDNMVLISLHKWPWLPKSGANLAGVTVWGCNHIPLGQLGW